MGNIMTKYVNIEELYQIIDQQGHLAIDDLNGITDFVNLAPDLRKVAGYRNRKVWLVTKLDAEKSIMEEGTLIEAGFNPGCDFRYVVKHSDGNPNYVFCSDRQQICLTEEEAIATVAKYEREKHTKACTQRCVANYNGKCCVEKCHGPIFAQEVGFDAELAKAAQLYESMLHTKAQ